MNTNSALPPIPIFLLKTKSTPNDGYEEQFSSAKEGELIFDPTFVPVLEHQLLEDGMSIVRTLLEKKQIGRGEGCRYGGMTFTSQRAVEAFALLVSEGNNQGISTFPFSLFSTIMKIS